MTSYILIDSKTRAPVPLPFYTSAPYVGSVGVHDVVGEYCQCTTDQGPMRLKPTVLNLELITEADFMAERGN